MCMFRHCHVHMPILYTRLFHRSRGGLPLSVISGTLFRGLACGNHFDSVPNAIDSLPPTPSPRSSAAHAIHSNLRLSHVFTLSHLRTLSLLFSHFLCNPSQHTFSTAFLPSKLPPRSAPHPPSMDSTIMECRPLCCLTWKNAESARAMSSHATQRVRKTPPGTMTPHMMPRD